VHGRLAEAHVVVLPISRLVCRIGRGDPTVLREF
jgi:hypothetical protein